MITVHELRIGNRLLFRGNEVMVRAIEDTQHPNMLRHYDLVTRTLHVKVWFGLYQYEPIPITPEILEACGFVKERDKWEGEIDLYMWRDGIYRLCVDEFGALNCDLKYLHQLQNVVHALSGIEISLTDKI